MRCAGSLPSSRRSSSASHATIVLASFLIATRLRVSSSSSRRRWRSFVSTLSDLETSRGCSDSTSGYCCGTIATAITNPVETFSTFSTFHHFWLTLLFSNCLEASEAPFSRSIVFTQLNWLRRNQKFVQLGRGSRRSHRTNDFF